MNSKLNKQYRLYKRYRELHNMRSRWGSENNPILWHEFFDLITNTLMDVIEEIDELKEKN